MSNSSRGGGLFSRRKSPAQVTVLEAKVHHTAARNAKASLIVVGLLAAAVAVVVLLDHLHPFLAVFAGLLIGAVAGGLAWVSVVVWPVVRKIWWWTPVIGALGLVVGFAWTLARLPLWVRLLVLAALAGLAALGSVRRTAVALFWCVTVRHRLREAFDEFITANKSGSLPFIGFAVPTPVGERVWVLLRSGLSLPILEARLDQLAVTCWASSVKVVRAREGGNAAFVRFDIKRREVLTAAVGSPLPHLVDPDTPSVARPSGPVPTALNLGDIPADTELIGTYTPSSARPTRAKAPSGNSPAATPATPDTDDDNEWI
ncbi:hypothetical protein CS0771_40440 [Catellatospora sp. IY07-71]|uniref:hypothetical protein n=1 Tax=Catellatospora sp. IY07-71 TaxID=2728827 RepID=UPI001BB77080|nr:hypothetical protein [Catellatospora sp. IY07-71]BCJ74500.1 hypothetical protein CS0771_40440 [Catellatospora sp. IY07-71]